MFESINNFIKSFAYKKYQRIENYIDNLENKLDSITQKDKNHVIELKILFQDRVKRLKRLYFVSLILYMGIYFSFISFVFTNTQILSQITNILGAIISFFGTTIFIMGIFLVNKLKDLYYQDLDLIGSHIISIYDKNIKTTKTLFSKENDYNSFISFFERRGF